MKKLFCLILGFLLLSSCSRFHLLGMQKHEFSVQPKHIIWFQVAGLSEEHVGMLRFASTTNERKTALESMECLGKMWSYNFYKLRPQSAQGFLSQMIGKDDITGTCQDYGHAALWKPFDLLSYKTYILESGTKSEDTVLRSLDCESATPTEKFLDEVTVWNMGKVRPGFESKLFHYQDKLIEGFDKPGHYFDRACQEGSCFSSLSENVRSLFKRMGAEKKNYVFIVRDFSFESKLKEGKIAEAREILFELEKLIGFFKTEAGTDPVMQVVVTSSAARPIEFPDQGIPWLEFENQGKNILYKKTALTAPAFSFGASSENFCGFFSETEVFSRLLWFKTGKDRKGLEGFWY